MFEKFILIFGYLVIPALMGLSLLLVPLYIGIRGLWRGPWGLGLAMVVFSLTNALTLLGQQIWIHPRLAVSDGATAHALLVLLALRWYRERWARIELRLVLPAAAIGSAFFGAFFLFAYANFEIGSVNPAYTALGSGGVAGVLVGDLARRIRRG